jgi:DNA helicase-2/ATP-dependent DNA helicase PcrA
MAAPILDGDALAAVKHRGSHLQIIAAAGSGKTEVVSQRVASLLGEGVDPRAIVAFTFTERAAEELRQRIELRSLELIGPGVLDRIGGLFVGTIHAYCFRLLQQYVARYETFDVLDENQLTAFLSREANRLNIRQLDPSGRNRVFASIAEFLRSVDVVENELLDAEDMPEPFRTVLKDYYESLERYRLLTYGQQIARAVEELSRPEVADVVHAEVRHLIVDEYQDVNPAQERLIGLLAGPSAELCVVGDDDQAIYQWRGSDVSNIVTFRDRYPNVSTYEITTNRRSLPQIVETANRFAQSIPGRLPKTMGSSRTTDDLRPRVVAWTGGDEQGEAGWIANLILDLNDRGVPFHDIAVLVRGRAAYGRLVEAFGTFDIPVQPGGRTGLFEQPEAMVLGHMFCWLAAVDWRDPFDAPHPVNEHALLDEFVDVFELPAWQRKQLRAALHAWKALVPKDRRSADLVGELYSLFDQLGVKSWDLNDVLWVNKRGTLARFTSLLADYESVRRRARPDPDAAGEQVGGQDRGSWYYKNLAIHIVNHAQGAYEGFDGEPDFALDAVDLITVHRAKGLEWPVVFVPSLTANRFPTTRTGNEQSWLVPRGAFPAERYEGSDADERRLFYVAATRARDWLSLSRHGAVTTKVVRASPYWQELSDLGADVDAIDLPDIETSEGNPDAPITLTYSELAAFLDCALAYRLRNLIGFQPRLAPELGYGKAVHHLMRAVAERTQQTGSVPTDDELDEILDASFFLPTANKPAHRNLKAAARRLVAIYAHNHAEDLYRVWETERPFELHLDGVTVTGRADVILDREGGVPTALAILDYKTSVRADEDHHTLQLQVYSDAGRREGLDVRGAYVHDLKAEDRTAVDIAPDKLADAERAVKAAADRLRSRDYAPSPGLRCRTCEVRTVCAWAQL